MGFVFRQVYDDKSSRSSDSLNPSDILFRALTNQKKLQIQRVSTSAAAAFAEYVEKIKAAN